MLHRFDRLPAASDEEADVVTGHAPAQDVLSILHLDLNLESEAVDDLVEQLLERLGRVELVTLAGAIQAVLVHRLRPERFFRLRGGRGGGAPALPLGPVSG